MSGHLDESYFQWLYAQVSSVKLRNPSRTYWNLLRILFTKEFLWFVPNDDNRVEDGKDLRMEFLEAENVDPNDVDPDWLCMDCSFLELLVGLSRRLGFLTSDTPDVWFWELIENLGLRTYNDRANISREDVENRLDRVMWRTYRRNGHGGLFPLRRAEDDQREVELWYQLNSYIQERA